MTTSLTFKVVKSDAGRWVCEFELDGQAQHFTGSSASDAVRKAMQFIGTENVESAEIVRVSVNGEIGQ